MILGHYLRVAAFALADEADAKGRCLGMSIEGEFVGDVKGGSIAHDILTSPACKGMDMVRHTGKASIETRKGAR